MLWLTYLVSIVSLGLSVASIQTSRKLVKRYRIGRSLMPRASDYLVICMICECAMTLRQVTARLDRGEAPLWKQPSCDHPNEDGCSCHRVTADPHLMLSRERKTIGRRV